MLLKKLFRKEKILSAAVVPIQVFMLTISASICNKDIEFNSYYDDDVGEKCMLLFSL